MPEMHPIAAFILGLILGTLGTLATILVAVLNGSITMESIDKEENDAT